MDPQQSYLNSARQEQLLRYIDTCGRVTIDDIAERFNVSPATARRELAELADQGRIHRVRGGAIAIKVPRPEIAVYVRSADQVEAKQRIGEAAARLVQDGETIFLGSGTTVLEVARHLVARKDLTVITNSLLIMTLLSELPNISLIVLGGGMIQSEQAMYGNLTEQAVVELRADKVIMGIAGVDPQQGLTNSLQQATTDRKIFQLGRENILVADHRKFGRLSTAFIAPISVIHTVVTDAETQPQYIHELTERGIKVFQV